MPCEVETRTRSPIQKGSVMFSPKEVGQGCSQRIFPSAASTPRTAFSPITSITVRSPAGRKTGVE